MPSAPERPRPEPEKKPAGDHAKGDADGGLNEIVSDLVSLDEDPPPYPPGRKDRGERKDQGG